MRPLAFQLFMNNWYKSRYQVNSRTISSDYSSFLCFLGREMLRRIGIHQVQRFRPEDLRTGSVCPDLLVFKFQLLNKLFPNKGHGHCTLMLMSNMAEPEWVGVKCEQPLLFHVFCEQELQNSQLPSVENKFHEIFCSTGSILTSKECYSFLWTTNDIINKTHCTGMNMKFEENIDIFQYLVEAIHSSFPPILVPSGNSLTPFFLRYSRSIYDHTTPYTATQKGNAAGFGICEENRRIVSSKQLDNLFKCFRGGFVSMSLVCDGKVDCLRDDSDEKNSVFCKLRTSAIFTNSACNPLELTVSGAAGTTFREYHGSPKQHTENKTDFNNSMGLNHHFTECETSKQGLIYCPFVLGLLPITCTHPSEVACKEGFALCYNISEICSYNIGSGGTLEPCPNGGHLWNCRPFQCNKMFKCAYSYCIPWTYVCDDKWDCPRGDDEWDTNLCDFDEHCKRMYKCFQDQTTCTHQHNVCDGNLDCPGGDDEAFCDVLECPYQCQCLLYTAVCAWSPLHLFKSTYNTLSVMVSHSAMQDINNFVSSFPKLTHLEIDHCSAPKFCGSSLPKPLVSAKVQFTQLKLLRKLCFHRYIFMKELHLPNDEILSISSEAFSHLPNLTLLNLSCNPLSDLPDDFAKSLTSLKRIIMHNVFLTSASKNTFLKMKPVQIFETSDFHLCCLIPPSATCTAEVPWYVSCSNLFPSHGMKMVSIEMSVLIIFFNAVCFFCLLRSVETSKAFNVSVHTVNFTNLFCGIYMAIMWVANDVYKESFIMMEHTWRSSYSCYLAFGLFLWFTFLSQLLFFFLPLSRLMVVLYLMDTQFKIKSFVTKCLWWQLLTTLLTAASFTGITSIMQENIPTTMCLPFIDPTHISILVVILACVAVLLQVITCITMPIFHFMLLHKVFHSPFTASGKAGRPRHRFLQLAPQLVVLTLSHLASWLPVSEDYVSAIFETRMKMDHTIWVTLICVPLNSIVFPGVLIFTSVRNFWSKRKKDRAQKK